jgi:transposase
MPVRPFSREQQWLLPPSLNDALAPDHPARFVAAFIDAIDGEAWTEMGIAPGGDPDGAPAYDARALLGVWALGFMTGARSSRALEAACHEQIPYLWLTGFQQPDHNTLWRFYQLHRDGMRALLKRSVRTAVALGLVDLALQAVDGTRVRGNAAEERTLDAAGLERLLRRTDLRIAELESQQTGPEDPALPRLPERLRAEELRAQVRAALARVTAEDGPRTINVTDPDAKLLRTRNGFLTGHNVQAMASPGAGAAEGGQIITAADLTPQVNDAHELLPMMQAAEANSGVASAVTLADAGYHSGANLTACAAEGRTIVMPDQQQAALTRPYHKEQFAYDQARDTYTCPAGATLRFSGNTHDRDGGAVRQYRAARGVCAACPAFGACTSNARDGRTIRAGPHDAALRDHRAWQASDEARTVFRRRRWLIEPVFSVIKDQQAARRFLLRGSVAVRAEWSWLATCFNLRTLARAWQRHQPTHA